MRTGADVPNSAVHVTDAFRQRIASVFGDAGVAWLARLPEIVAECAERWNLTVEPPFDLSYNYVAPAICADGTPVVLKLRCPNPEAACEMAALHAFAGDGICDVIEQDPERNASLLERVMPGIPLTALVAEDDERATAIAIDLMQRLWRPPPAEHPFPTVADWAQALDRHRQRFDGGTGPLPAPLFEEAEALFSWLLATSESTLLHGDLHHDNILSATRAPWLIIDPKGIVGDPGYDLGAFLYNPWPGLLQLPDPARAIARRVDQLAEGLGMERARVRGWGIAQAVLSACWSVDNEQDWRYTITCGEHLSDLKP
jgi:streptomycin 6-kinase